MGRVAAAARCVCNNSRTIVCLPVYTDLQYSAEAPTPRLGAGTFSILLRHLFKVCTKAVVEGCQSLSHASSFKHR